MKTEKMINHGGKFWHDENCYLYVRQHENGPFNVVDAAPKDKGFKFFELRKGKQIIPRRPFKYKIPGEMKFIDSTGQLFEYHYANKSFVFVCHITTNQNDSK